MPSLKDILESGLPVGSPEGTSTYPDSIPTPEDAGVLRPPGLGLGLGNEDNYLSPDDVALLGNGLVASRAATARVATAISSGTAIDDLLQDLTGIIPMAPFVVRFDTVGDGNIFGSDVKPSVIHHQVGVARRNADGHELGGLQFIIQRYIGTPDNVATFRDWTTYGNLPGNVAWNFYARQDIEYGYRIKWKGSTESNWSSWSVV